MSDSNCIARRSTAYDVRPELCVSPPRTPLSARETASSDV